MFVKCLGSNSRCSSQTKQRTTNYFSIQHSLFKEGPIVGMGSECVPYFRFGDVQRSDPETTKRGDRVPFERRTETRKKSDFGWTERGEGR